MDPAINTQKRSNQIKTIRNEVITIMTNELPQEKVIEQVIEYLTKCPIDITTLIDAEKNTILQICFNDQQYQQAIIITEAYNQILNSSNSYDMNKDSIQLPSSQLSTFNSWLLNNNVLKQNIFEMIAETNNINPIATINGSRDLLNALEKYITIQISNCLLTNDRMNVFHYASTAKNIYAILFFYDIFHTKYSIQDCINKCTLKNQTKPIHSACYSDDPKTVDTIIDLGGDINALDYLQMTPLHIAVSKSNTRIAKKLVLNGASKDIMNNNGRTPYDLALNSGNNDLIDILAHKSFFQVWCKCQIEYTSLKNKRKDYMLISIILCILCLQISFYTLYQIQTIPNSAYYALSNLIDAILFFSGIIFEIALLVIIVLFAVWKSKCKGIQIHELDRLIVANEDDEHNNTKKSLCQLYLTNEAMCFKCRKNTIESTIHCISCDKCIEHWDHHCFYLNCCIHSGNMKYFKAFCIVASAVVITFGVNCAIAMTIMINDDKGEIIKSMLSLNALVSYNLIEALRVISIIMCVVLIMCAGYALIALIAPFMLEYKEMKKKKRSEVNSSASSDIRTALVN